MLGQRNLSVLGLAIPHRQHQRSHILPIPSIMVWVHRAPADHEEIGAGITLFVRVLWSHRASAAGSYGRQLTAACVLATIGQTPGCAKEAKPGGTSLQISRRVIVM
jgi:hypothetical protein